MQELINTLQAKIPEVFESEDYRGRDSDLQQAVERHRREIIEGLSGEAKEEGFILQVSQVGIVIIPATKEGQPLSQEELAQLSEEDRQKLKEKSDELQEKMKGAVSKIRDLEAEFKQRFERAFKRSSRKFFGSSTGRRSNK